MWFGWISSPGFRPEKRQGTWFETTGGRVGFDRRKGLESRYERNGERAVDRGKELRGQSESPYHWQ